MTTSIVHEDTRTEAERRYDAERDGQLYVKPEPAAPQLDPIDALHAQIAAETDPDMKKRLICRMADQVFTMEEKDTDWYTYRYGTAQLDVEEEPDGTVKYLTFEICGREVSFKGSDLPAVRDLAGLLHNHSVQHTLEFTLGIESQPVPLTLSHFDPTYTRERFDNGSIHEYEAALCLAMARMGLSDVAMRDLFGHVLAIADAIAVQQRSDGYGDGLGAGFDQCIAYLKEQLAERKAEPQAVAAEGLRRGEVLGLEKPPTVAVERDDDGTVTYRCGANAVYFDPTFPSVQMAVLGCSPFEYEQVAAGLPDLVALMSDPRVQSLRRGEVLGLEKPVTAVRHLNNDDADPVNFGKEEGTEYTCGEVQIYFPDSRKYVTIDAFDTYFEATLLDRDLHDLATLLNDPRVAALRRGEVLGLARSEVSE